MGAKKYLSADGLYEIVWQSFLQEKTPALKRSEISWTDCMMSGLAIFGLKFPSLLQYDESRSIAVIKGNLKNLYKIKNAPSDTCLRERLDTLSPRQFRRAFKAIFASLQRSKIFERFRFLGGHYLLSVDGTGQFSSQKVHCQNCCEKKHRSGEITYYHQMLGAAFVHPDEKAVIPIAPEPIVKGDGNNKNDCGRNAAKRLLRDYRREHPHLKTIVVEDALAANYPHLALLDELKLEYVIGVKSGDHEYLFDWIKHAKGNKYCFIKGRAKHKFCYYHNVPLNDANHDYLVNVIEYWEEKPNGKTQHFTWITSLKITDQNVFELMLAGRARWKIENETFNTLKNQGYNFEHNYGHGNNNLCSNFTMLMMLQFLIDQVLFLCCDLYQKAKTRCRIWKNFFAKIQHLFLCVIWDDWQQFYSLIANPEARPPPNWYGAEIVVKK